MTILSFKSENVKKLSVVEFTPTATGLVIVAGKNGQGKSSVLDSIEMAMAGADHIPSKPVRRGQDKATTELTIGDLTVKRTITPTGGGSLIVRNKDGIRQDSPQKLLDSLYGKLSFDPLEFARQKAPQRSETLRALLGLDFSKQQADYDRLYAERTESNRVCKAKEAMLKSNPRHQDVPKEEQLTATIIAEMEAANKSNAGNEAVRRKVSELKSTAQVHANTARDHKARCEVIMSDIERLKEQLKRTQDAFESSTGNAEAALNTAKALQAEVDALKDIDVAQFKSRIFEVESINHKVRKNKQIDEIAADFKKATKESEALTQKLEAIENGKREAIAAAKFPVPGLSLSDTNEVMFNSIPFDSCSTAEQLKISVAMGFAMNPKLRVMLVRQGNDLDDDNLKLMAEMAEEAKGQIWIERVDTSGTVSVIIEDGHIKETEPELLPAA